MRWADQGVRDEIRHDFLIKLSTFLYILLVEAMDLMDAPKDIKEAFHAGKPEVLSEWIDGQIKARKEEQR